MKGTKTNFVESFIIKKSEWDFQKRIIIEGGRIMPNIVLTRIDNRLVHGQVATQWCGSIGANLILVANDNVAGDKLRQGLMDMAAPSYAAMRYWTLEKTISTIHKASDKQMIFIVCETPQDVLTLVEGGVPIGRASCRERV